MSTPNQALSDSQDAVLTTAPQNLMQRLLNFEAGRAPVISLYLDSRANEQGKRSFDPFVRKQFTERGKTYPLRSPERQSFEADSARITKYLEDQLSPAAQGVAIFACSASGNFFEVGQFAAPIERNRLVVSDRPDLYPLARLIDQYRRYAVVLADTNRAQIFVFAAAQALEQQDIENVKTKHIKVGGWAQARYQRHEENYHLHHAKEVVQVLERTVAEERIEHLILAGDKETVIPILKEELSQTLSEKVIDVLSLSIDTPAHELLQESLKAFQAHDSLADMEKVERLLNEYRADNLAVAGVPATLAALSNGQVEELLIAAARASLHYDEAEVEKVLKAYEAREKISVALDQGAVADELVRRAHQLSSARVTFVEDTERLERVGGVGALLRYRVSEESAAPYEQARTVSRTDALTAKNI